MGNRSIQAKILKIKRRGKAKVFSRAMVNTGQGPNQERMQEYYSRVTAQSFLEEVSNNAPTMKWWPELNRLNKIILEQNGMREVYLYFSIHNWFFVEIDHRRDTVRRSREYGSRAFAMGRLDNKMVAWVELISLRKTT